MPCGKCINGEIVYKLPVPAPRYAQQELIETAETCTIPCPCTGLILRQIPFFASYMADQRGGIYSLKTDRPYKMQLKPHHDTLYVRIYNTKRERAMMPVAKLILMTFGGPPYQDELPWFRNGDLQDVRFSNLEWRLRTHLESGQSVGPGQSSSA